MTTIFSYRSGSTSILTQLPVGAAMWWSFGTLVCICQKRPTTVSKETCPTQIRICMYVYHVGMYIHKYVYVCMCMTLVCIYTNTYMYVCVRRWYVYTQIRICMYVYHVGMYIHKYVYVCMCIHKYIHKYTYMGR